MTTERKLNTIVTMTKKMRVSAGIMLFLTAVVFSGCELVENRSVTVDMTKEVAEDRPGVSLTGTVVQAAGKFFLQTKTGNTEITSRKLDLGSFVGKSVEVSGEFSGTTLYLDSIK